tara:strand:- start:42 stop:887 length:846 start_codon:yes stop_codon:yes gene_type:complete
MAKKTTNVTKPVTQQKVEEMTQSFESEVKLANKEDKKVSHTKKWEIKNRDYYLIGKHKPLSYSIKASNIYWFDEEKGYERELKNTSNQRTPFVDEMVGEQRLEHIIFRNGVLHVPKHKVQLQKILSLYHPWKGNKFDEYKPVKKAHDELLSIETEVEALNLAMTLEIDVAEAIMRAEIGSKVAELSSKELKRDLVLFAKRNPNLFIELAKDENVMLRNFGIKAVEMGIIRLSSDQRTFLWASNNRKLMNVPFDEHPYSALAAWFKTDEGMEIYSNIEKRLN